MSLSDFFIDDEGDVSGVHFVYEPANAWLLNGIGGCDSCPTPNISDAAHEGSYHGALFNVGNKGDPGSVLPTASVTFFGTAVTVNCILSNALSIHRSAGLEFNNTIFASGPLELESHTLQIRNGKIGGGSSLVLLDFITYSSSPLGSSSRTSSVSPTIPASSPGAQQSGEMSSNISNTHRSLKIAVGTAVPVGLLFIFVSLFIWVKRRPRHRQEPTLEISTVSPFIKAYVPPSRGAYAVTAPGNPGIAPSNHSDNRSIIASTVRRQYLERELRAAQEKIIDINDLERHNFPLSGTVPTSRSERIRRLFPVRGNSTRRNSQQVPRSELDAARQRNEELLARIRDLEAQMESAWALGLSDEPPPGYSD
ncbi:hypothetical protein B0H14DRAFT_3424394 [Mycena olivaceomarginata]|nr:hypothetical protein B0H14DRAFT_3424394 [Mycena olivaceomarginata]